MGIFHDNQVSQYENVTILDLIAARMMAVVVTTGAIRRARLHSICHHQQTNTLLVVIPVAQPTASEHGRDNACSNMCTILNLLILLQYIYCIFLTGAVLLFSSSTC